MAPDELARPGSPDGTVERLARDIEAAANGDIVIERLLGDGRAGLVYLASQKSLGRSVAVKILQPRHVRESRAVLRFKREARAMAGCPHSNILSVYTVGETAGGIPFFVMEYIEGETLEARLARKGKLPLQETVRLTTAVADALTYAHERGLIHRDVKPANILIENGTGRVLIADFGLAKSVSGSRVAGTLTGTGQIVGTPRYLSPEQAESGRVDARSDQYSLAVIVFEMIAGRPPFLGPGPQDYVRQHADETPPSLASLEPQVPVEASRVVERGLMKEPGARFASAEAFGQALRGAATDEPPREARRRPSRSEGIRLIQVAALYAGVSWGVLEALSWVLETFQLPMEFRQPALWMVISGFPIVMAVTWYLTRSRRTERAKENRLGAR